MAPLVQLVQKINGKTATVGVMGLGYVGLPLSIEFARKGFKVIGFDVQKSVVAALKQGKSHVGDVQSVTVKMLVKSGRFQPTARAGDLKAADAIIICVPTPLRKSKEPDVSYIVAAAREIAKVLHPGQLVILESTTYPGTTRELVLPMFEKKGLKVGRDFHLAFSPERVDPGNKIYHIFNTPKVVGGITPSCTKVAGQLYAQVVEQVVAVSTADSAEMVKLLENTFRSVNIGMVNELAQMCHKLGLNVWEIIGAAGSKPFGFMPFYPGPGIGGHCIPLDPYYLAWKAKSVNFEPRFIELAGVINSSMPEFVVRRMSQILNGMRRSMRGSKLFVLGVAYKPNVSDVRESPALDVLKLLHDSGANVSYHDPYIPQIKFAGITLRSKTLSAKDLRSADLVVVLTAHGSLDYPKILKMSRAMFDSRNALKGAIDGKLHRL